MNSRSKGDGHFQQHSFHIQTGRSKLINVTSKRHCSLCCIHELPSPSPVTAVTAAWRQRRQQQQQ